MMENDPIESRELAPVEAAPQDRLSYPRPPKITELDAGSDEAYSYVRAYWRMLVRHGWTILTVAFVVTMLVALISFRLQPVYQATARVEIEAATPEIRTLSDLFERCLPTICFCRPRSTCCRAITWPGKRSS